MQLWWLIVCVTRRARNVELIESRLDLPRQVYQQCTRTRTSRNKSASLDHCNTLPANTSGSVSNHSGRPPAGSLSFTNFVTPGSSVLSRTSSKDSASDDNWRPNHSYEDSKASVRSCAVGTSHNSCEDLRPNRDIPSYHNTTQSSSSLSRATSSNYQQPVVHNGQLILDN